jgi:plasmid replication initiation protein
MLNASITDLKKELHTLNKAALIDLCLNLAKFKKDSKELLCYLLFEAGQESLYIESIKEEIKEQFKGINTSNYHYMKKGIRKVLRNTKKFIRYSKKKETEVDLLLYFCQEMKALEPSIQRSMVLVNLYERTLITVEKAILKLHEDLQYDYTRDLNALK